jgi:uncharacterized membrane protein
VLTGHPHLPHFTPLFPRFVASGWQLPARGGTVPRKERNAMELTPAIAIHMTAALGALATGPVALWARKGAVQRPKLHRAFGYAWITLMLITAASALFIRGAQLPNIAGYSPIHLLVPLTLFGLYGSFRYLARGNIAKHRQIMQILYYGACVVAGAFTLLPGRFLGELIWVQWLGLLAPHVHPAPAQALPDPPLWVFGLLAALLALAVRQAVRKYRMNTDDNQAPQVADPW